jgi:predicted kinase
MQPAEVCRHGVEGAGKTVVVFFGMIASGKSTLGQVWAQQHRAPYYNTDRVRKELAGLQPTERRPEAADEGIYAAGFTERTYRTMLERTAADFSRGAGMVGLDGSYSRRTDREAVRRMAAGCGARSVFVLCACSAGEVQRRLALRARDPGAVSDGRWEIYLRQQKVFELPDAGERDCLRIDTEQEVTALVAVLTGQLGR